MKAVALLSIQGSAMHEHPSSSVLMILGLTLITFSSFHLSLSLARHGKNDLITAKDDNDFLFLPLSFIIRNSTYII
ncbi:hypothetical protein EUTSA_v10011911mg [Eutrema salsugineum]|uniref:Uncharacterized protein n=1 Tax=Eutrema salsugineum TaxID=72664 RepID=V4KHP8_EUTSA|nr:hypothetical protein EUTSA_v10011911mg [Eutrema salsugineum]